MEEDENVIIDTPIDTEETESPADSTLETIETPEVDVEQLQATNKKLYERAKKAEADLKAVRGTAQQASPNVEETVLLANGMDEKLMEQLKKVAAVQGISLLKAQADPIFVAVKEKFEKDQKQAAASMPASRGAGAAQVKKTFNTPGLSREEHMALSKAR